MAIANDTVINFRNETHDPLIVRYLSQYPDASRDQSWTGRDIEVAPGRESGFAAGFDPWWLTMDAYLLIGPAGYNHGRVNHRFTHRIWCENHEGWWTPDVTIYRYNDNGRDQFDISGERDMGENTTFEIQHDGYKIHVHRWSDGKEPLDDYDEWYTRFFVTMFNT